ncbi:MAG: histidine kinase [Bryobacteraceae bacterium]
MGESSERGKLKVFLGYAAGVGKTYQMLQEAQKLKLQGRDIVIGYFEPHARKDTIAQTEGLEAIPRRQVEYRGTRFEEMDTVAILVRRPEVCVVDEFPHTNVPGSERDKRWQDVQVLLDAGINVLTTMNIQHLESLNDQVSQISGIRVRETVPDWVMQQADEVVMVDVPPPALVNRLLRGVVYPPDKAKKALEHFFKEPTLVALRELALRQTAHEVESRQLDGEYNGQPQRETNGQKSSERILVYVSSEPSSVMAIRRAKRVADYLHADCLAVAIHREPEMNGLQVAEMEAIERHLNFARNLHVEARLLQGSDAAKTLVEFAHVNGVTQLFVARPAEERLRSVFSRNIVQQVVRFAPDLQVTIVADRART